MTMGHGSHQRNNTITSLASSKEEASHFNNKELHLYGIQRKLLCTIMMTQVLFLRIVLVLV